MYLDDVVEGIPEGTLREALLFTARYRWAGRRSAERAPDIAARMFRFFAAQGVKHLDDLETRHVTAYVDLLRKAGLKSSSIVVHLSALSTIGREALKHRPPLATRMPPVLSVRPLKELKWWLDPETKAKLVAWLRDHPKQPTAGIMADYIEFVTRTGLRVEEALPLRRHHFHGLETGTPRLTVPGRKTTDAQATVPISSEVAELVSRRLRGLEDRLFPVTYAILNVFWRCEVKPYLGVPGRSKTCTLRALRRTFGAYATARGMPTERLQKLYRHRTIETTIGYLRLVGSEDLEACRQWL